MNILEGLASALAGYYGRRREKEREAYERKQQEAELAFRRWLQMRQMALEQAQFEEGRRQFEENKRFQEAMLRLQDELERQRQQQLWQREEEQQRQLEQSLEKNLRSAIGAVLPQVPIRATLPSNVLAQTAPLGAATPTLKPKAVLPPQTATLPQVSTTAKLPTPPLPTEGRPEGLIETAAPVPQEPAPLAQAPSVDKQQINQAVKDTVSSLTAEEKKALPAGFNEMPLIQQAYELANRGYLSLTPQIVGNRLVLIPRPITPEERQRKQLELEQMQAMTEYREAQTENILERLKGYARVLDLQELKAQSQVLLNEARRQYTQAITQPTVEAIQASALLRKAMADLDRARIETEKGRVADLFASAAYRMQLAKTLMPLTEARIGLMEAESERALAYAQLARARVQQLRQQLGTTPSAATARTPQSASAYIEQMINEIASIAPYAGPEIVNEMRDRLVSQIRFMASQYKWSQDDLQKALQSISESFSQRVWPAITGPPVNLGHPVPTQPKGR